MVTQGRLAIPVWHDGLAGPVGHDRVVSDGVSLGLVEPAGPGGVDGGDFGDLDPVDGPGDGDGAPEGAREGAAGFVVGRVLPDEVEAGQVPVPLLRQRGDGPVGGVEDQVGGGVADLQRERGVAEEDDAEHEQQGGEEGEQAVHGRFDGVGAGFRVPEELARDLLVALDDQEGAVRVLDDDVAGWHGAGGGPLLELERAAAADADQGRDEREHDGGEQGHAVFFDHGQHQQGHAHGAAEDGQEGQRAEGAGFGRRVAVGFGDAHPADVVGRQGVAVQEEMGDMVDMAADVPRVGADHRARGRIEPLRPRGPDERLRRGEDAWQQKEAGQARDLGVGEDRRLTQNGQATFRFEKQLAAVHDWVE